MKVLIIGTDVIRDADPCQWTL